MEHSAGLLLYRSPETTRSLRSQRSPETTRSLRSQRSPELEVFLGHFGGPYWQNKDAGAWTIPKGLIEDGEDPFDAARREFEEETGITPPSARDAYVELGTVQQSSNKQVAAWAVEADVDPDALESNTFELEWPPNSGTTQRFPELDRAAYFGLDEAADKIVEGQCPFLDRLRDAVSTET